jgi:hypothetical protein
MTMDEDIWLKFCSTKTIDAMLPAMDSKLGASRGAQSGLFPLNGLRHRPEGATNGWYIWAESELGTGENFFEPIHLSHIPECCPLAWKYLGLPPGWRFLVTPDYEDVWFDPSLI